uniref:Ribosomal protein S10 n=1 Tax=Ophirina amphinema TaxID=2108040 RepID=A0A348AYQ9_9EUKA|nr:ribosomal protein S10 [Ophirina amphinema]
MNVSRFFCDSNPRCISYIRVSSFSKLEHYKSLDRLLSKLKSDPQLEVSSVFPLLNKNRSFTVLRSPHIDKKSREQFGQAINRSLIIIKVGSLEGYSKLRSLAVEDLEPGISIRFMHRFVLS